MHERIAVGFQTFVDDSPEEFGAVRDVAPDGRSVTVYVENAGDFVVPRRRHGLGPVGEGDVRLPEARSEAARRDRTCARRGDPVKSGR